MGRSGALITERDGALLSFIARHRIVLASHVGVLLGISSGAADARLRALRRAGMVAGERFIHGQPRCWWITRRGLAVIDSPLPPPRMDLRAYRHDIGLAWVTLAAERGAFGHVQEVVCERRMRSRDGLAARSSSVSECGSETFGVRLGGVGPAGRERLHYPDLLLITPDRRRIAVELELTSKARSRRERILAGYGADSRIDTVLYLVDRSTVARSLETSAGRLGISSLVHVQRVQWSEVLEGGSGLASARSHFRSSSAAPRAGSSIRTGVLEP
jgi:hypothetical protein